MLFIAGPLHLRVNALSLTGSVSPIATVESDKIITMILSSMNVFIVDQASSSAWAINASSRLCGHSMLRKGQSSLMRIIGISSRWMR
jgi:hypothetical protein